MKINITQKIKVIDAMYDAYNLSIRDFNFMCKKHCSYCCTCNLTVTSLEAYKILSHLRKKGEGNLKKLKLLENKKRFIPSITTNKMAKMCSYGNDIPEENIEREAGKCPFLSANEECTIYEVRPFGCRCMLSNNRCIETGFADIDSYLLTVNSLFIQYIEHIDYSGYTSNLTDMLIALSSKNNIYEYENDSKLVLTNNLINNQTIHALMIPPEHIEQIQPLIEDIKNVILM